MLQMHLDNLIDSYGDIRYKHWFLMSSIIPTLLISTGYVVLVKKILPKLMEHRKPFVLNKILLWYNAIQVLLSIYIFYYLSVLGWMKGFSNILCEPIDTTNNPDAIALARTGWWYFMSKYFEFFDTIFFLLRKKNSQVTNLHVIHHGIMPIISWISIRTAPGGTGTIFGVINCFVHIIMYGYYMVAAMGPQYHKYLWWKKYLTVLQLIQFVIDFSICLWQISTDCNVSKIFSYVILFCAFMFFSLFLNFYLSTYNAKAKQKKGL